MKLAPTTFTELRSKLGHDMSLAFEKNGYSPLVGRIFSLLMFSAKPISLQDITTSLHVSKAAVSVQVRAMERDGMCRKAPSGRDRKDYYYIAESVAANVIHSHLTKVERVRHEAEENIAALLKLEDLEPTEYESYAIFKQRYSELASFYRLFEQKLRELEQDWNNGGVER
ncbi:GbsR/MarR family transcriptional regulator [Paenibacillus sp. y28]|uniref:GbsR/MarR family transcriptional regulator n=1 Tax=Paenibacillus sp. y28 TaxID=3129110 RepID=UPI00301921FF